MQAVQKLRFYRAPRPVYPLAVGNLLIAALNAAHKLGEKIVTRDVIDSL